MELAQLLTQHGVCLTLLEIVWKHQPAPLGAGRPGGPQFGVNGTSYLRDVVSLVDCM